MCDPCNAIALRPTNTVPRWLEVPVDDSLTDRRLPGRIMSIWTRGYDDEGNDHLTGLAVSGTFTGAVWAGPDASGPPYAVIVPNPDAEGLTASARAHAREIIAGRAADALAGREAEQDIWGPLTPSRHLILVSGTDADLEDPRG